MGRAETLERILGGSTDGVAISLFDGSRVGPVDAPVTIHVRSDKALAYIATASGDLGLARAYVAGEIDVEGDLYTALKTLATMDFNVPLRERIRVLRELGGLKLLLVRPYSLADLVGAAPAGAAPAPTHDGVVCADVLGAGIGEDVVIAYGHAARVATRT